jgi:hypothetical protein
VKKKRTRHNKPLTLEQKARLHRTRLTLEQIIQRREQGRARYAQLAPEQKAATAARRRVYNKNNEKYLARTLWERSKHRAERLNIPFNIALSDIVVPERCPIFGRVLQVSRGHFGPNSPSLDHIDPTKGYVNGNIAVISHEANMRKTNATAAEHRRIANWMEWMGERFV